jgi:hypothetical protein
VKAAVLFVLVLAAMRVASWAIVWLLRLVRVGPRLSAGAGNLAAFGAFAWLLWWNLVPGEPMDGEALLFGLAVFALYGTADCFWTPFRIRS